MSSSVETAPLLRNLLDNLTSNDNTVRATAEEELDRIWVIAQPNSLLLSLSYLITHDENAHIRSFSAVLLRRFSFKQVSKTDNREDMVPLWERVNSDTQQFVQNQLIQSLAHETDLAVRHKICDTVSYICRNLLFATRKWHELSASLIECVQSSNPIHRESAFRIYTTIPELLHQQPLDQVKTLLATGIRDPEISVKISCLSSSVAYLLESQEKHVQSIFAQFLPEMLAILEPLVQQKDEDMLAEALSPLMDLAEALPKLFRGVLHNLMNFAIPIIKSSDFEDRTRQSFLELLMTITESCPSIVRKLPEFVNKLIPIILEMMSSIEEDEDWYYTDDLEGDDNDENYVIAEQAIDRIARALGGKHILPISFQYIPSMLGSPQWNQRYAGLMAISSIAEGCVKIMTPELGNIIKLISPYIHDQHPRVRYAACNALGQLSTDFAGLLQNQYHELVLPCLITGLEDVDHPRVQAHAAAALVNFCEEADKKVLDPYLDTLFEKFLPLLNSNKRYIQEQVITTIACVADSSEEYFTKYYSVVMPLLLNILQQASETEYRLLRGKAMECSTLIALSVGKETFRSHAQSFIDVLGQIQNQITEPDDPQSPYLIAAWARLCKVLKSDFTPYLPLIMPSLLQSAQLKPDFAVVDDQEDPDNQYSAEEGWEFVPIDGQQVGIKTTVLEEKCTAVEMFLCYARELGANFQPYVQSVLDISLPLLKFYFHDGVREAAAQVIPHLLDVMKKANTPANDISNTWKIIYDKIMNAILGEADPSFQSHLYSAISDSIDVIDAPCLHAEQMHTMIKQCIRNLRDHFDRIKERDSEHTTLGSHDDEDDEEAEQESAEEDLLNEISKLIHNIFKSHRESFLSHFEQLIPVLNTFLVHHNDSLRHWSICIFDDLIEFTGPLSWNFQEHFLPALGVSLSDSSSDIRQAASYGIGVAAQFGGDVYAETCAQALTPLFNIINSPSSRSPKNSFATENAISAVTKICRFNSSKVDLFSILPLWLNSLPILNDEEEMPLTYLHLMDLFDINHPAILGLNQSNIPKIITIFIDVLMLSCLPKDQTIRMQAALQNAFQKCPPELKHDLINSLTTERKQVILALNIA